MRLKIQLLLTLFFLSNHLFAQKSSIVGNVVNNNEQALAGATILLKGTVRSVQTNSKGAYEIKGLNKGIYKIQASFIGKKDSIIEVSLSGNQTLSINFKLNDKSISLNEVELSYRKAVKGNEYLPEVNDFQISAAKKNELIKLDNINANLAMNNSRQIFGRVPGISVWENDGSGIQLGVASRGLSPNRSWEFNVRMNGYDITPDPMGYPEAYYTPPMEVVDRIEIIRGASSLQYGPQFGGLMNFILRKPDISTKFTFESQNTLGSNGLFSTFNYVGGTAGRLSYTAYYQKRRGNGWRDNGFFNTDHAHFELSYELSKKFRIGTELTYMTTESQQPGGLTDAQFNQNARQSLRNRNWFSTPWFIPSLTAEYVFNEKTKLSWKAFSTIAERNSVGFVKAITEADDLGNRQVDRDFYTTFGSELRLIHNYELFGTKNTLATGLRYFNGNIDRKQLGVGNSGREMNFDLSTGTYPRDLDFSNINTAAFAENIFRINDKLLITGGVRLENINSTIKGKFNEVNGNANNLSPTTRKRSFLLFGAGAEYKVTPTTKFYSNISQAYRPVLISDLTPPATTDVIDQDLQDASGYNFDLGYRGEINNFLDFDIDYFYLNYDNRIGTITQQDANARTFQFRTNLGKSVSKGFEAYIEFDPVTAIFKKSNVGYLSLFASLAYIDATYTDFKTTTVTNNQVVEGNLAGKRVENAPRNINRFGATYSLKNLSITYQLSSIGESFADASNTVTPNAAATTGLIPGYKVQDVSANFKFLKRFNLKTGINNLGDKRYFTRRAGGYPGPGIMPADGRTAYISLGLKL